MAKHLFLVASAAAALALSAYATQAVADSFTVSNVAMTVNPIDAFNVANAASTVTIGSNTYVTQALSVGADIGEITFTGKFASAPNTTVTIPAWCIDLYHEIGLGNNTYSYSTASMSTNNAIPNQTPLTTTQMNQMASLIVAGDSYISSHSNPSQTTSDMSAAYQLAIWAVEYDGPGHTASFSFSGENANVQTDFSNIMANLPTGGSAGALVALNGQQGFASAFVTGGLPLPTPEPATLAVLGAGLAGLGWARRRRH